MKDSIDKKTRKLLEEIAKRPPLFSPEKFCFAEQIKFIRDPAKYKVAVCSRRAGKTIACAVDLLDTAIRSPKSASLYITLSRLNAKRIIWSEILEINRTYGLGGIPNETELSIRFANGHILYLSGAKDKTEVEKYRGFPLVKVYIDEAQAFRPYIEQLIDDVLSKSLFDYDGTLCLTGTPSPIPVGYFYEQSKNSTWSSHHWTMMQNPHLHRKSGKTAMELILQDCKRMGVAVSDPKIQRECFGKWVTDSSSLVFKYDDDLNHYHDFVPTYPSYVIGVDLGFNDADALAVIGWNQAFNTPGNPGKPSPTYLVHEKTIAKQGITELAIQLDELIKKYNPIAIVMDSGGLGKKIVEELRRRYGLPIKAAEKARKFEYIELLNDALRNQLFLAKRTGIFANDTKLIEWDKSKAHGDRLYISDTYHSDIADAVLYAFRESLHYISVDKKEEQPYGTASWFEEQEKEFIATLEARLREDEDDPITWRSGFDDEGF